MQFLSEVRITYATFSVLHLDMRKNRSPKQFFCKILSVRTLSNIVSQIRTPLSPFSPANVNILRVGFEDGVSPFEILGIFAFVGGNSGFGRILVADKMVKGVAFVFGLDM